MGQNLLLCKVLLLFCFFIAFVQNFRAAKLFQGNVHSAPGEESQFTPFVVPMNLCLLLFSILVLLLALH